MDEDFVIQTCPVSCPRGLPRAFEMDFMNPRDAGLLKCTAKGNQTSHITEPGHQHYCWMNHLRWSYMSSYSRAPATSPQPSQPSQRDRITSRLTWQPDISVSPDLHRWVTQVFLSVLSDGWGLVPGRNMGAHSCPPPLTHELPWLIHWQRFSLLFLWSGSAVQDRRVFFFLFFNPFPVC